MRRFLIAGNWKMNGGPYDAAELLESLKLKKPDLSEEVDVLVCPPFVSIGMAVNYLYDTDYQVGAQNLHFEENGAYTGEISANMIAESGCNYVIIGHSERREYFGDTDETVNKKIKKALESKLASILCVGESLEQRKAEEHFQIVENQIKAALQDISDEEILDVVIAYEPIWAIGTGKTASPREAEEMHAAIRAAIATRYNANVADSISLLYGGSCNPTNAKELFAQPNIDGGLIGGASLKSNDFLEIAKSF